MGCVVDVLERFGRATREWFGAAFAAPTEAQAGAWRAIGDGHHALVVAPTGSGKTLAAFLFSLDRLAREPIPADPKQRCRVLYVSPLKALAVDVERNLRAPLAGIRHAAARLGVPPVIVDEVHAVAATKRGAHLALSLERLDAMLPRPAQRIGLSATVRPIEETARFLGGSRDVAVVEPRTAKTI